MVTLMQAVGYRCERGQALERLSWFGMRISPSVEVAVDHAAALPLLESQFQGIWKSLIGSSELNI